MLYQSQILIIFVAFIHSNVRTKNVLKLLHVNGTTLGDHMEVKANLFKRRDWKNYEDWWTQKKKEYNEISWSQGE